MKLKGWIKNLSAIFGLIFCLYLNSEAQTVGQPVIKGTIDFAGGVVSFDASLLSVPKNQPGTLVLDTSNIWYNDRKVPIPANIMRALQMCEPLDFGRIEIQPINGEKNEEAANRQLTEIIETHIKNCFKKGAIILGGAIILNILL
jgi:hypothetical protein